MKNKIGKIAVDLDDVLTNTTEGISAYFNHLNNTSIKLEDHTDFDLTKIFERDEMECKKVVLEYLEKFSSDLMPFPGSQETLADLSKQGIEIAIVSSRPIQFLDQSTAWIDKHFGDLKIDLYLAGQKHSIKIEGKKKSEICREIGAEILIDDSPHHAVDCVENGIAIILYDMPWNRSVEDGKLIKRVRSWREIKNEIGRK